jgi:hypothetical protein
MTQQALTHPSIQLKVLAAVLRILSEMLYGFFGFLVFIASIYFLNTRFTAFHTVGIPHTVMS